MINVHAVNEVNDRLQIDFSVLENCCRTVLRDHDCRRGEITFIFTTDAPLNKLKIQYFDQDVLTDVIAFNLEEEGQPLEGEVYISWDRTLENANLFREEPARELKRLAIHAILHLIGFDDGTEQEKARMSKLENHYLEEIPGSLVR
ncbi:MAG: rRNA maturation RNase YbeY [FCB group bacterium]|nr:rRNA maturation RNase YbeY [FCB group bacterium]